MMNVNIKILKIIMLLFLSSILWSCNETDSDSPYVDKEDTQAFSESTILIYAVATNSLSSNLISDKKEIIAAAEAIDLKHNNVLLFQCVYEYDENYSIIGGNSSLLKLIKSEDRAEWELIKEYSYDIAPLNPKRISEVIDYTINSYPAQTYGMVFWSHSTASTPYFPTTKSAEQTMDLPMEYSFGEDKIIGSGNEYYQINIDELAEAVPDNLFNFIWFDSCYMSNIETIYQFRNKCEYFIGYPTEVLDDGMPYHYTLPLLSSRNPDVVEAANRLFEYYTNESYYHIATIAVIETEKLDSLKDFCQNVYHENTSTPSSSSMLKYTNNRQLSGPFFDLGDYTKAVAELKGEEISNEEWQTILNECVLYKAATTYDFNNKQINQENYSGISTYNYNMQDSSTKEKYYESLDWFRAVYK